MKISIAIVTFNEAKNIERCVKSASFADEIVVVDGRSSDETAKIAKRLGCKVFVVDNQPLMKKNMNLAFEKCSGDWIFSLDADEEISPELKDEMISLKEENVVESAFKIPRKNLMFGKWIEHTGWYPDYQWRLFRKGKAKFPGLNVHEELIVDGRVGEFNHAIIHHHYENVSQFISKIDSYTTYEANKLFNDKVKLIWSDAITYPFSEFLSRFFARKGYLDGMHGLILSLLMAFYWELIFIKLWEKNDRKLGQFTVNDLHKLLMSKSKEYLYWFRTTLIDVEKSKVKAIYQKIKRKINA